MNAVNLVGTKAPVPASAARGARPQATAKGHSRGELTRGRFGLSSTAETYLAVGVVAVVALLVVPMPPFLLDGFLALSFALSIVVLVLLVSGVTLYLLRRATD